MYVYAGYIDCRLSAQRIDDDGKEETGKDGKVNIHLIMDHDQDDMTFFEGYWCCKLTQNNGQSKTTEGRIEINQGWNSKKGTCICSFEDRNRENLKMTVIIKLRINHNNYPWLKYVMCV